MSNIIILSLKVYLSEQQEVTKCYQCTNCVTPWEEGNFRNQIARCKGESSGFLCKVNIDFTNSIINALINLLNLQKITVQYPLYPAQVTKACVPASECIGSSNYVWSFGTSIDCCNTDLCNYSISVKLSLLQFVFSIFISLFLFIY